MGEARENIIHPWCCSLTACLVQKCDPSSLPIGTYYIPRGPRVLGLSCLTQCRELWGFIDLLLSRRLFSYFFSVTTSTVRHVDISWPCHFCIPPSQSLDTSIVVRLRTGYHNNSHLGQLRWGLVGVCFSWGIDDLLFSSKDLFSAVIKFCPQY